MTTLAARRLLIICSLLLSAGCAALVGGGNDLSDLSCDVPSQFIADGGPGKDGIPSLTDPTMVAANDPDASYLLPNDRVIGLRIGAEYLAIPLNIGWWHEIVNVNRGAVHLSITHCPLTGSSLVFDRTAISDAEFGVSGLLFMNNLMMYDRTGQASLWPQMVRGARCGARSGTPLPMFPSVEISWAGWIALHPDTRVVSSRTGHSRNYTSYPYGNYAQITNPALLAPMPSIDGRRPPKERVLGVILANGAAVALPFGALDALGALAAIPLTSGGATAVVLWNRAAQGAAAFLPSAAGQALTFRVAGSAILDDQTGSSWSTDGRAIAGPLAGTALDAIDDAFVAYWFAWAAFYPESVLWTAP